MHFANPPSWWLGILIAAAIAATAFLSYRRPLAPLSPKERGTLMALRTVALLIVAIFLARPIVLAPPAGSKDAVVPSWWTYPAACAWRMPTDARESRRPPISSASWFRP
jgi:hypothetical protein